MVLISNIFLICGLLSVIAFNSTFAQRRSNLQCLHRCANERCILDEYICDGYSDCSDNSDELNCPKSINASSGCIVLDLPKNGYILIESTNISANPGDILPESTGIVLKCNDSQHTSKTYCHNSKWSADLKCPNPNSTFTEVPTPPDRESIIYLVLDQFTSRSRLEAAAVKASSDSTIIFCATDNINIICDRAPTVLILHNEPETHILAMCPQLQPQRTITVTCSKIKGRVNRCDHPQPQGTVARFTCKPGYKAEFLNSLQCKGSTWRGKMPTCNKINRYGTCVLPPLIDNGGYTIGGRVGLQPGDVVSDVTVLVYECYGQTELDGNRYSFCVNGAWTSSPKCLQLCDPLASSTVEYSCVQPSGRTSSCKDQQPSGTVASSSCKSRYYTIPKTPLVQLRCNDGFWDNPLPRCHNEYAMGSPPYMALEVGRCIMPKHPTNGRYIAGVNRDVLPGDELPGYALIFTECDKGYATIDVKNYVSCYAKRGWGALTKCHKMCPPLIVPHVKFTCEIENRETWPISMKSISCLEPMNHGSVASGDCKPSFFSDSIIPNRTCVDGVWDKPSPVCKPKQWGEYIPIATNGSCVLPDQDVNGQFVYSNDAELTTGDVVPDLSIIRHTCNHNYELNGQNFSLCINGSWNNMPKCLKTCEPLNSITVDLTCRHDGTTVNCMEPLKNGTTVESNCKESYSSSVPVLPILVCINGNWNKEPPKCTPECGTIIPKGQKKIMNGSSTELGEFPWHVGLYDISQNYLQICGGSIVNAIVVVTAAHCVWNDFGKRPAFNYAVAGVKYYRDWKSDKENENLVQRSMVTDIVIPDNYGGAELRQQSDIALLTLTTPFKFTSFIRPVCLDWDIAFDKLHLSHGNFGKVTGWGLTDVTNSNSASPILLTVQIPYVDYKQCRNETPIEFAQYLGIDKICAGYKNEGTAVCRGDSGGGLVFVSSIHSMEQWYLRGIVSVGPKDELNPDTCHSEMYTGFTHVLSHAEWLKNEIYKRTPY